MEDVPEFKTHDFYIASILKSVGFPLLRLDRQAGSFVDFIFHDPDYKAEETIDKYWNRTLSVNARDIVETINELKTRIRS